MRNRLGIKAYLTNESLHFARQNDDFNCGYYLSIGLRKFINNEKVQYVMVEEANALRETT
jgi:hypothetical protein